jgi:GntR family transcriptional repressor for pyruvate dehydrogenase complex
MQSPSQDRLISSESNGEPMLVGYRSKLTVEFKKALEHYIVAHNLQPGDKLPTEAQLSTIFGTSRTVVRETMKLFEVLGIVSIETGRGTFLRAFDMGSILSNLPAEIIFRSDDMEEILEVRRYLEQYCVEKAAQIARTQPKHPMLMEMQDSVSAMKKRAAAGEDMWSEDVRFHRALAQLADNRILLMILEIFWSLRPRFPIDNSRPALQARYQRHQNFINILLTGDAQNALRENEIHFSALRADMQVSD